jgi:very-short-patch-repair endonuclease
MLARMASRSEDERSEHKGSEDERSEPTRSGDESSLESTPKTGVVAESRSGRQDRTYLVKVLGASELLGVRGTKYQKAAAIAVEQYGRVSRRQLIAAGVTPHMIDTMLRRSALHRLHAGVYAVGHLAPIELGREAAALLACREGSVLSHLSAGALWALLKSLADDDPVDVMTVRGDSVRRAGIRAHRTMCLDARDTRVRYGLPVTSPARTLLDLAECLTERETERALDEGLSNRTLRLSAISDLISRTPVRRGRRVLNTLLERRTNSTLSRSEAEERMLALVREAHLPAPFMNMRLHGYEVDFAWPEQHVVVEVDGYRYHSTRSAFEHDRRKDAVLLAAGWIVLRVTWEQLTDEPFVVVALLAQALAAGNRHVA